MMRSRARWQPFGKLVSTVSVRGHQLQTAAYSKAGRYPIVDQSPEAFAGRTDEAIAITDPLPLIAFGDHTKTVKLVHEPFVVGADGVKLLRSTIPGMSTDYVALLAEQAAGRMPTLGYARHFASLSRELVPVLDSERARDKAVHTDRSFREVLAMVGDLLTAKHLLKRALMQRLLEVPRGRTADRQSIRARDAFVERDERGTDSLPLLSVTADQGVIARDDLVRRDTSSADKSNYKRVVPGDIAYNTMRMWQGVCGLVRREGIVSPAYTVLTPRENVSARYCAHLFKVPRMVSEFRRHSQGLVEDTWNLKFTQFGRIRLSLPSFAKQERLAVLLEQVDGDIRSTETLLAALGLQKRGVMQKLLSGEIDLPGGGT